MTNEFFTEYARLIVKVGVNVQKDEEVFITCPVFAADLAHALATEAYEAGAKKVTFVYKDEEGDHLRFKHEAKDVVTEIDKWLVEQKNYAVEHKCACINVIAEDPDIFSDVNAETVTARSRNAAEKFKKFHDATMSNSLKWCIAAYAFPAWAKKVFPDLSPEDATKKLWRYIATTMRMDEGDSVKNWQDFQIKTSKICAYLNEMQFESFRYENSLGTDLSVGMPQNYHFSGAGEPSQDGVFFVANMPTEEVFSAPHKDKVNGIVYSAIPLVDNGVVIDKFWVKFENGKAVDFGAEQGYDALKEIIEYDDTSCYLGEIAFVEYDSPIRKLNAIFYNTLFDENASCHLAFGRGYPECVEGGSKMTPRQLVKAGVNFSHQHCDFMVGTPDLKITAFKNGKAYPIFENGNFVEDIKK